MRRWSVSRRGFTLLELLVVMAVIATLAAILFPVFAQSRERARQSVCLNNLKQIGTALYAYLSDWDDTFPLNRFPEGAHAASVEYSGSAYNWKRALFNYISSPAVFECPSNDGAWEKSIVNDCVGDESNCVGDNKDRPEKQLAHGYATNAAFFLDLDDDADVPPRILSEVQSPSHLIYVMETAPGYESLTDKAVNWVFVHPDRRANWLFADTHVKTIKVAQTIAPVYLWRNPNDPIREATLAGLDARLR